MDKVKSELARYAATFDRYANQAKSSKVALAWIPKQEKTVLLLHDEKGYEAAELTFLVEACYTIIAARDVLKWSYPLEFFEGKNFPNEIANLYENFWQADLDRYTNQLQGFVFEVDMN